jgi:PAS domain S-box-containing protein
MHKDLSLLDRVFQSSLAGIHCNAAVRNAKGEIVDFLCLLVNSAGSKLVNAPLDWQGRTLLDCFPQALDTGLFDRTVNVVETGQSDTFEYQLKGVAEERWVRLELSKEGDGVTAIITDVTQLMSTQRELQQSRQQLRNHLLRTPLAAIEWDLDFRIRSWNPAAESMFGWSASEALGQHATFIVPPCLHEQIDQVWKSLLHEAGGLRNTNENLTKHGETILCEWFNTPLVDDNGKVTGVASFTRNITHSRKAELELNRTNRALKMLSSCDAALIREVNEQSLLSEVCRVAVEIGGYRMAWVGYTQDDPLKTIKPLACAGDEFGYLKEGKFSWSEERAEGQGIAGKTVRTGNAVFSVDVAHDSSFTPWKKAAEERGFRSAVCLPLHDKKRVFGILALYSHSIHQISAEEVILLQELADNLSFGICYQRAEAQVREQASLLDKAQDAILLRGLDGIITYWNKGAERLYGWTAHETIGRSVRGLLYDDSRDFDDLTREVIEFGEMTKELDHRRKDGSLVKIEARITLVRDQNNRPKSILAINTDITERKKIESQFLRVQRMESIGTLAGGIAHDLNNVLAPILMSVRLLKDKVKNDDGLALLETLKISAERGADLIRQVLSFARGEEGQRVVIRPADLVSEIQGIIRDTFPKNIRFACESDENLWTVTGDVTQLHQVMMNLCVNARDAMPKGGALAIKLRNVLLDAIFVAANPGVKLGPHIVITIIDTGVGIPAESCDKIFEPFYTTKQVGQGTGLGLSTSLAIVRGHGGILKFDTEKDCGTSFSVFLPANATRSASESPTAAASRAIPGSGELILVVDDEESIRAVAGTVLEEFGYRVLCATNGEEALKLYRLHREEIAAVLTDMTMPVKDGRTTILELKALNPKVKIIASSGLQPTSHSGGWMSEVDSFISKPYSAEALLQIVSQVIGDSVQLNQTRAILLMDAAKFVAPVTKTARTGSPSPPSGSSRRLSDKNSGA